MMTLFFVCCFLTNVPTGSKITPIIMMRTVDHAKESVFQLVMKLKIPYIENIMPLTISILPSEYPIIYNKNWV